MQVALAFQILLFDKFGAGMQIFQTSEIDIRKRVS